MQRGAENPVFPTMKPTLARGEPQSEPAFLSLDSMLTQSNIPPGGPPGTSQVCFKRMGVGAPFI